VSDAQAAAATENVVVPVVAVVVDAVDDDDAGAVLDVLDDTSGQWNRAVVPDPALLRKVIEVHDAAATGVTGHRQGRLRRAVILKAVGREDHTVTVVIARRGRRRAGAQRAAVYV